MIILLNQANFGNRDRQLQMKLVQTIFVNSSCSISLIAKKWSDEDINHQSKLD